MKFGQSDFYSEFDRGINSASSLSLSCVCLHFHCHNSLSGGSIRPIVINTDPHKSNSPPLIGWICGTIRYWQNMASGISRLIRIPIVRNDSNVSSTMFSIWAMAEAIACVVRNAMSSTSVGRIILLCSNPIINLQGCDCAANWLILANSDKNFVISEISPNQVRKCSPPWGVGVFAALDQSFKCYDHKIFPHILANFASGQSHPCVM